MWDLSFHRGICYNCSYLSGGDEEEASNQHLHDEKLNEKKSNFVTVSAVLIAIPFIEAICIFSIKIK
jgi:hypothetical protein